MEGFLEHAIMGESIEVLCTSESDADEVVRDMMFLCNDMGLAVEIRTNPYQIVVGDDFDDGGLSFRPIRIKLLRD